MWLHVALWYNRCTAGSVEAVIMDKKNQFVFIIKNNMYTTRQTVKDTLYNQCTNIIILHRT